MGFSLFQPTKGKSMFFLCFSMLYLVCSLYFFINLRVRFAVFLLAIESSLQLSALQCEYSIGTISFSGKTHTVQCALIIFPQFRSWMQQALTCSASQGFYKNYELPYIRLVQSAFGPRTAGLIPCHFSSAISKLLRVGGIFLNFHLLIDNQQLTGTPFPKKGQK